MINKEKEVEILNAGINYAMEFGKEWLQPTQNRLALQFPELDQLQLNSYDEICRGAMNYGNAFVYDRLSELQKMNTNISLSDLYDSFDNAIKEKYSWINNANLKRLFNQGMYYAWKDGLDSCVK